MANNVDAMTYVVVGASGGTGKVVAEQLLASGKKVRAIGRNPDRLKALTDKGAESFIASAEDESALIEAFSGAQAVYSMIPTNLAAKDPLSYQDQVGEALAKAIADTGVPYVVSLSAAGATRKDKLGPIVGLYYHEQRLNKLPDAINVVHLRAPFFMENFLGYIDIIKKRGVIANPLKPDFAFPMIASHDIASEATRLLLDLNFSGKSAKTVLGQRDLSMAEATEIIGKAINREIRYVQAPYEEYAKALIQSGFSPIFANSLTEMYQSINEGISFPIEKRSSENTTPTSFEQFAQKFAAIYNNSVAA